MNTVIVTLAFFAVSFSAVFAIQCYECSITSNCADPFTPSNIIISNQSCEMCMKTKAEGKGVQAVLRGCLDSTLSGLFKANECQEEDTDTGKTNVCLCDTDLCNHGNTIEKNLTKTVTLGMFVWILKYFYM
ncbi:hypothetical protein ACF0H5_014323 [Mactra antiquata]